MSSSSRPKLPLSPLCGFSPQTPMRGRARPLRRSASSIRRIAPPYPLLAEQARHLGQGYVGGHPRGPEVVEDVELAERATEPQALGEPVQLVAVVHAGHVQRGLVQRAEEDRVGPAAAGQFEGQREGFQAVAATDGARFAAWELVPALAEPGMQQWRGVGEIQGFQRVDAPVGEFAAGDAHAAAHFRFVGDQHDVRLLAHLGVGQQAGDQFRADAGRIAQDHGQSR